MLMLGYKPLPIVLMISFELSGDNVWARLFGPVEPFSASIAFCRVTRHGLSPDASHLKMVGTLVPSGRVRTLCVIDL